MMAMRANSRLMFALAGALVGLAACGNSVPPFPSYEKDVKPIMEANCIRCHGAGGTLNTDPYIPPITNPKDPCANFVGAPHNGYFTQLADLGPGKLGLMSYTGTNMPRALMTAALPCMPPAPSHALGGYELDVFQAWLNNPLP
jgi:hypothetical protein